MVFNKNLLSHDHNCIGLLTSTDSTSIQPQVSEKRNLNGIDIEIFARLFYNMNVQEVYCYPGVDEMLECLVHKVNLTLDQLAPVTKTVVLTKNRADWLTKEHRDKIMVRSNLRTLALLMDDGQTWSNYKNYRNELTAEMRKAKREHVIKQEKP